METVESKQLYYLKLQSVTPLDRPAYIRQVSILIVPIKIILALLHDF